MIRLEGPTLPAESQGAVPPIVFGDVVRDVPGIPLQIGHAAAIAKNCGINATDTVLDLAGPDIVETLAAIKPSGVVQIDDEWALYSGIRTTPPGVTLTGRGYGGTTAAPHGQGATVLFIETRPIYVLAYVPPGCSYPPNAVVNLRVNDGSQFPASTIRLADPRIVPGHRFVTVEFDASRSFGGKPDPPLPSSLTMTRAQRGRGFGPASQSILRMAKAPGSGHGANLGFRGIVAGRSGSGSGTGKVRLLPPPSGLTRGPSNVAAPMGAPAREVVRLTQSPLGRVSADMHGLRDTPSGRYTGTANGAFRIPAHIVRFLMEETFRETDGAAYHDPTWTATAARQSDRGIVWRLAWTGDAFDTFRDVAESGGQADLYIDEEGRWRYAFRDPSALAVATVTPRELIGDPGVAWTEGRDVITELEVDWGSDVQGGSFTLKSPAMADRHDVNHGAVALPYAATESVARILARHLLSRRDRPRQTATVETSHALLALTLRDRVFVDTALLAFYGARRVPYDVVGVTDRGDIRVYTLLESDPLALAFPLSGTLVSGGAVVVLDLSGAIAVNELAFPLAGTLVRPGTPIALTMFGRLLVAGGGAVSVPLTGSVKTTTGDVVTIPLTGTLQIPGAVSLALAGTLDEPVPPPTGWRPDTFHVLEPGAVIDY